jgi:type II secretory pathway pseudopilin PulG
MLAKYVATRAMMVLAILSAVVCGLSLWAGAQTKSSKSEGASAAQSRMEHQKQQAKQTGAGHPMTLSATLTDPEKKAQEQEATVEVKVAGVQIIDPAAVQEKPQQGQGHLHYQVDGDPIIATTATKLSFHELSSGEHKITVMLVGNDHKPLGPQETLTVAIPAGKDRAQR